MKDTTLGANVDFGYLDGDDDDTGGALDPAINAIPTSSPPHVVGASLAFEVTVNATEAMTLGEFTLVADDDPLDPGFVPTTVTLPSGWVESGWSGGHGTPFSNTFTAAVVASGATLFEFSCDPTISGELTITTSLVESAEAAGTGGEIVIDIAGPSFDAIPNCPATDTPAGGWTFDFTVDITCDPLGQTNGAFTVFVYRAVDGGTTPETLDLQGWGESGWQGITEPHESDGSFLQWNNLTRTTVADADAPSFRITGAGAGSVQVLTADAPFGGFLGVPDDPPQTDQATGVGGSDTVTIV